ncbi:MAG: hypothetical protein RL748_833 [Pseudomonadota bacterium]|jgi:L-ascorbate metabolism protein UlaG (beta-lactamase superfamily)
MTSCSFSYFTRFKRGSNKFANSRPIRRAGLREALQISWRFMFNKPKNTTPAGSIPVQRLSQADLLAAPDHTLFRLGHSTVLLKLRGEFFLTDPVFSERASPVQWMGPQRFHASPISIADLPAIKAVILSHDHFDHLDHAAIVQLAHKVEHFITPLGVGERLIGWGVPASKVQQLDWWQSTLVAEVRLTATPAQHYSGRGMFDSNRTLWASWVVQDQDMKIFFSGDSGYFDGFKQIGDKFGPFDLTMIETGSYDKLWPDVHMQPEQSLQAHLDLRGKQLLPIHNGTFDLALHAWHEPFDRIVDLAEQSGVAISTPAMGQALNLRAPENGTRWWQLVQSSQSHESSPGTLQQKTA